MKCGTAEIQGWLSQHPNMQRWGGKQDSGAGEAHFFDRIGVFIYLYGFIHVLMSTKKVLKKSLKTHGGTNISTRACLLTLKRKFEQDTPLRKRPDV